MTRVEKETLLALNALGRRQPHTTHEVTMKRLQRCHTMIALEKRGLVLGTSSTCPARNADKTYRVVLLDKGRKLLEEDQ